MPLKGKILVLRFSAMGDVAMVASVLREFSVQNTELEFIVASRAAFKPFFNEIDRLTFHAIEPKTKHKGLIGLFKLFRELHQYKITAVADLHDNLRSRIVSTFFRFAGIKIERIDKGRAEKRALTRTKNKVLKPLKLTVERYADVFRALGLEGQLSHRLVKSFKPLPSGIIPQFKAKAVKKIGISPFAQHSFKVYPLPLMEEVIAGLDALGYQLFIFGGGSSEKSIAAKWATQFENVNNLIGNFTLSEELAIISNLDLMLSMDSAGMHIASLMGVRVISIWGPTHPYAGFLGYGQTEADCIQSDSLNRPSSIYGNKPCNFCMDKIKPSIIINKIKENG
ncbi:MAG: glycosyltransferase family 9 protein [Bacteroidota bacterium]